MFEIVERVALVIKSLVKIIVSKCTRALAGAITYLWTPHCCVHNTDLMLQGRPAPFEKNHSGRNNFHIC